MKPLITILLFVIVGCDPVRVGTPKPEYTSDAELIAWKDGPAEKFKGKVFRVRAEYDGTGDIRQFRSAAKFRVWADDVRVTFVAEIPESIDIPKVTYAESAVIEFTSTNGETNFGNKVVSISR